MSPLAAVRTPGVLRTLALSLVARVPGSAIALLLVLQARHLGHSYAIGGIATGAFAIGMAVGAPLLGRSADHRGPSLVLRVSSALAAASLVAIAALPRGSTALALVGLAALAGITQPPVAAAVRAIWVRMLPERVFNATLSVEASLQELAFILGPLVLGSAAADAGPAAALALAAVVLFAATAAFALDPEARATAGRAPAAAGAGAGPLVDAGVRLLVGLAVTLGVAFGATEVGIVAFAEHAGASHANGFLFGLWGVGSLLAGLLTAQRAAELDAVRLLRVLLVALGATSALLALAPDIWAFGAGLALAGAAVAPLFAVAYRLMGVVAPPGTLTEAYSWETTGIMAGVAIGLAVGGALASAAGPAMTFVVAGAAPLAGALLARVGSAALRRSG